MAKFRLRKDLLRIRLASNSLHRGSLYGDVNPPKHQRYIFLVRYIERTTYLHTALHPACEIHWEEYIPFIQRCANPIFYPHLSRTRWSKMLDHDTLLEMGILQFSEISPLQTARCFFWEDAMKPSYVTNLMIFIATVVPLSLFCKAASKTFSASLQWFRLKLI